MLIRNTDPTQTTAWQALQKHFDEMEDVTVTDLFAKDGDRFSKFPATPDDQILVDYPKNHIIGETLAKLQDLVRECDLTDAIRSIFFGGKINRTENRVVLHVALYNRSNTPILVDDKDMVPGASVVPEKMRTFSEAIISGEWRGYAGKAITNVMNIGIGGFNPGLYMVTEALRSYKNRLNIHFVSNIDETRIAEVLKKVNPETALFLIASKIFTIRKTVTNAHSARDWFLEAADDEKHAAKHFATLSTNTKTVGEFGVNAASIFELWDWAGGRYSLWSTIGLSTVLSIGSDSFIELLSGAHAIDKYFSVTLAERNSPMLPALIDIQYNSFFGTETEVILSCDQYMHRLTTYFQQSNTGSSDKCVNRNGNVMDYRTGPIIRGKPGTNSQYAFYQLTHQGIKTVSHDFIAPATTHNPLSDRHQRLLFDSFTQAEALAFGKSHEVVGQEYRDQGKDPTTLDYVMPFKIFEGSRPTNSVLPCGITPFNPGALITLCEHKIFIQGVILNIFTFDQWDVEPGEQLANHILPELKDDKEISSYDSSTNGLINRHKAWCG